MKTLTIERTIDAPRPRVWRALTDYEDLKKWLPFFSDFKAKKGFETEFELGPGDQKYLHQVKVLDVVEGESLTYSWDYGGMSEGSSVKFDLIPEGNKTRLILTCLIAHIPDDVPEFMDNAREGWTHTADGLKNYIEEQGK